MSKRIEINFRQPPDEPEISGLVHRVRNLGEHLVGALHREGLGTLLMTDADRAIDRLRITGVRKRMLRRAITFVKAKIIEHGFSGDAGITSGSEDKS